MKSVNRIKGKIEQIEKLLAEVKKELEIVSKGSQLQPKKLGTEEHLPSEEELKTEYEKLYEEFVTKNSKDIITTFIKGKSRVYLKAFCRANNLPLDASKVSKEKIAATVLQWMKQRKAITNKAL
jgi:hypothetical protein